VNEAGLLTFQCQTLRRRPTTASNANPATNTNNIPGSGTTRISASFSCADSRRHTPKHDQTFHEPKRLKKDQLKQWDMAGRTGLEPDL
jgi:hypothetical protein